MTSRAPKSGTLHRPGFLLGFALGGFFDGILLHQILQWHHLLSLVEGVGDVRSQILFDGLFHALMYVVAAIGVLLLFRARRELAAPGAGRPLFAHLLIGFGMWHVLDSLLSHWILGIHRIRLDSPTPLLWDLIWFAVFGLVPLVLGQVLRRGGGSAGISGRGAAIGLVLAVMVAGPWAAQPPADERTAIVVFGPSTGAGEAVNAIHGAGGKLLWHSRGVWAVRWPGDPGAAALYRSGALLVTSSFLAAGCLAWSQV